MGHDNRFVGSRKCGVAATPRSPILVDVVLERLSPADAHYMRVGRVVSHAALMEQWVFYLADTLDRKALQEKHAGKHGVALVEVCRDHLDTVPPELAEEINALLTAVDEVLKLRNVVVHSVSAQPGDPIAYAHRPLPKNQRTPRDGATSWIADAYLTVEFLDALDGQIIGVLERLISMRPRAQGPFLEWPNAKTR